MADVANRLPARIEAKAVKREFYATEIVRTDGGTQHTNQRWSAALAEWDINIPMVERGDADHVAVKQLFEATAGSALTFDFHDFEQCADVEVRLKDDMLTIDRVGNKLNISMTLERAR